MHAGDQEFEFLDPEEMIARCAVTEIAAPRGSHKSQGASAKAVALAHRGHRVLYLDADNPPPLVRKRFAGWGDAELENLKVMTRNQIPPLTTAAACASFPVSEYDVVFVDSWESLTAGTGEQDRAKPSLAITPLLNIAHQDGGPAIIVLFNTTRMAGGRGGAESSVIGAI